MKTRERSTPIVEAASSVTGGQAGQLYDASADLVQVGTAAEQAENFLSAAQVDLSARFATRGIDRFAGGGWSLLETGEPVLDDSPRWLRAEIVQRTPIGSSQLVCLQAIGSSLDHHGPDRSPADAPPLVYHDRVYHRLGNDSAL